jgi:hypothetical protein
MELRWTGLRPANAAPAYDLLAAITKRFGLP